MQTIEQITTFTTEVNRSKFIAYIVPISVSEGFLEKLKKEYPKASHVVYALRYHNEYEQIVENSSDDGEPKGSAGVPILNVLRGKNFINSAVYVVRYFGGIKLGVGGLARAYALSIKNLLDTSVIIPYVKKVSYTFSTSYSEIDRTLYRLKVLKLEEFERDFGTQEVVWKLYGSEDKIEAFKKI